MRCFYVFLLSVSIASGLDLTHDDYKRYWQEWKSYYGKSYKSDILDKVHFAVWKNNLEVSKFYFTKITGLIYSHVGNPVPPPQLGSKETQGTRKEQTTIPTVIVAQGTRAEVTRG